MILFSELSTIRLSMSVNLSICPNNGNSFVFPHLTECACVCVCVGREVRD